MYIAQLHMYIHRDNIENQLLHNSKYAYSIYYHIMYAVCSCQKLFSVGGKWYAWWCCDVDAAIVNGDAAYPTATENIVRMRNFGPFPIFDILYELCF